MIKTIVFLTVVGLACGDYVDKFVGTYVVAAGIVDSPRPVNVPNGALCRQNTFAKKRNLDCTCGGVNNIKTLEFAAADQIEEIAIVELTGVNNIDDLLKTPKCTCDGKDGFDRFVLRRINDNFVVYYEINQKPDDIVAVIFSRGPQTLDAIEAAMKSVPEFKDIPFTPMCVA